METWTLQQKVTVVWRQRMEAGSKHQVLLCEQLTLCPIEAVGLFIRMIIKIGNVQIE